MLGPSVQQRGLNSRESDVRNVPASDVQWSIKDEYILLNLLPASSAIEDRIFLFFFFSLREFSPICCLEMGT